MFEIAVVNEDAVAVRCDILVLKYAQGFHGADATVAAALGLEDRKDNVLAPGGHLRLPSHGKLGCRRVLFLGVPSLWEFSYAEIRSFSLDALRILAKENCERDTIAFTMHGVGYGLDEREAFTAEIAGMLEYHAAPDVSWRPRRILIVEKDVNRAERLKALLHTIVPSASGEAAPGAASVPPVLPDAGRASARKMHVFVAMPYDDSMEDVYEFGLREPINAWGCLCERCDRTAYTGDVLDRIRERIASAAVVIADVSGANPNVYLEIGYAWGKGVPTLLVARAGEELLFDLRTHRCLFYRNVTHLRKQLNEILPALTKGGAQAREALTHALQEEATPAPGERDADGS